VDESASTFAEIGAKGRMIESFQRLGCYVMRKILFHRKAIPCYLSQTQ
jgi:hypothetical protein